MASLLEKIKADPQIKAFIKSTDDYLQALHYTEHGFRHVNLVSDIAKNIAREIGLPPKEQELCAIAAYLHDIGNFIGREQHHYWGCFLVHPVLRDLKMNPDDIAVVLNAMAAHDKMESKITSPVAAITVLADKSDIHRSRVPKQDMNMEEIKADIHTRVNYAATKSFLEVNKKDKTIILKLDIDTRITSVEEFFEISTDRMVYCRKAAEFLDYKFGIIINNTKIL